MDNDIFRSLEEKITCIESDDVYKRKIGNLTLWFAPLSYSDQNFVSAVIDAENITSVNLAKMKALSRSIVGIDEHDLRQYRNGTPVFEITGHDKKKVKVDLAKYMESKIHGWGQNFADLAFDIFADISETSRKKFSEGIVLENTKEPRIELAELESKVHELRSQLGMPLLVEKPNSKYATSDGEPHLDETAESVPDLTNFNYEEESEQKTETVEDQVPLVEEYASEEDILKSVEPPVVKQEPSAPEPVRTIPISAPPPVAMSPIAAALEARKRMNKPVRGTSAAHGSSDAPFDATPSVNSDEVIESRSAVVGGRPRIDPGVSSQSVNPRFKRNV